MKKIVLAFLTILSLGVEANAQLCGIAQSLTSSQQLQISSQMDLLDTALKYEDFDRIDSLSAELKNSYATQGGLADAIEEYYTLDSDVNWLNVADAIQLSQALISSDSMVYVDLWKAGKGMNPPLYQDHSLFLRASAEIAVGLLKIADKEPDLTRKAAYQLWATRALDSLATMQLPSGAFPFPDLRTYDDPVFTAIIQNFLEACGADSINVLQNGWIVDDKGTGEFKFDAGVIANAYYEAYQYTGISNYKYIAVDLGNYLKPLKFNVNYNYNTFVSLGLTRAYQLTNDTTYLNRALLNLRYAVYPGQMENGRWVDGHNANSRYHSIIIQNSIPTIQVLAENSSYKSVLESMAYKAVKNMVEYSNSCNSATGYKWLMKAYGLDSSIIPETLKDSIIDLIGQHINQSDINGKYLDIPTMGDYLELLDFDSGATNNTISHSIHSEINVYPNPTNGITNFTSTLVGAEIIDVMLYDMYGRPIEVTCKVQKTNSMYGCKIDMSNKMPGIYFLSINTTQGKYTRKIIRSE